MQRLIASDSPRHFMVPLPPGIPEDAAKLFGFYSYEFRTCHDLGWSTAQGRFSAALRVTRVQHSAPPLTCMVLRNKAGILASAPFATPVVDGRSIRPLPPATKIYVMIYAQVTQCDDADRRNVLLSHKPASFTRKPLENQNLRDAQDGNATWSANGGHVQNRSPDSIKYSCRWRRRLLIVVNPLD
jgi:hypothetical protein